MEVSRRRIWARRAAALLVTAGLTAGFAALLSDDSESPIRGGHPVEGVPERVRGLVRGLTVPEKVDQVMAIGFAGTDATAPVFAKLGSRQLGAVFVGPGNWVEAAQGAALVAELRVAGKDGGRVPPLIIARQGGGGSRAFGDLPPAASQPRIASDPGEGRIERWAQGAAEALKDAGFDLNLGPIADVTSIASPLADRSFGEDAAYVAALTTATIAGCERAGLACAPSHFPGQGSASADTDLGPATVGQGPGSLARGDLVPFKAAFRAQAPAVVLSHAFFAAYDPVTPASQTRAIATGMLRGKMHFRGVAITDDLDAGAVTAVGSVPGAAVASLRAGCDLLLIESPGVVQARAREAILAAARSGELSARRLDEAAGRVLELKRALGLLAGGDGSG
jgi:beta-N-acetylhexosaminidase